MWSEHPDFTRSHPRWLPGQQKTCSPFKNGAVNAAPDLLLAGSVRGIVFQVIGSFAELLFYDWKTESKQG